MKIKENHVKYKKMKQEHTIEEKTLIINPYWNDCPYDIVSKQAEYCFIK